jgi:hypothetical protein
VSSLLDRANRSDLRQMDRPRTRQGADRPDLVKDSEYLRASAARQLLEQIRPELDFAGVKTNLRATAAKAPAVLEQVVQDILADRHPARDRVKQEDAAELKARLVERAGSTPSPSDEELAAEIVARRHP